MLKPTETSKSQITQLRRFSNYGLRLSYFFENQIWKKTIIFVPLKNFKIVSYMIFLTLNENSVQELAREPNICVVKGNSTQEFQKFFQHLDIPINSNVFIAIGDFSKNVSMYDVYRAAPYTAMRYIHTYKCTFHMSTLSIDLQNGLSGEVDLNWRFYIHINGCSEAT